MQPGEVPLVSHRCPADPGLSRGCNLQLVAMQGSGTQTSKAVNVMAMVGACFTSVRPTPLNSAAAATTGRTG